MIQGGEPLTGEITAAGNKNAALPILAACLLTATFGLLAVQFVAAYFLGRALDLDREELRRLLATIVATAAAVAAFGLVDVYAIPLYDALTDRLSAKRLKALMAEGLIEIAPVGFMRGRTLNNAFVVIDEAQNCTYGQIKMLLTRLGWHSTMVLTGDPDQTDLLEGLSGLSDIARRLFLSDKTVRNIVSAVFGRWSVTKSACR